MTAPTQRPAPTQAQVRAAWEALAPAFDRHITPRSLLFAGEILSGVWVEPGTRLLDVAAGSGALALPAARRGAQVVAVDIAPTMVDRLIQRAHDEGLTETEVRALVMDGERLELDDDRFDVSVSLNGVSLFPGLHSGLTEMARVTRTGGTVLVAAFALPQHVEFIGWTIGALKAAVPGFVPLPADPPPLPFRLADPDRFTAELRDAGLRDVAVRQATVDMSFASAAELLDTLRGSNPIGAAWLTDLTESQAAEVRQILDGMLRERSGGGPGAVLHAQLNIGTGVVP